VKATDKEYLYALGTLPGALDGAVIVVSDAEAFHLTGKAIDAWREVKNSLTDERKAELRKGIRKEFFEAKNEEGQLGWISLDLAEKCAEEGNIVP
jgi:hypothetical protein